MKNKNGELILKAENAKIYGGSISGDYVELDGQKGAYIEWNFNMSYAEKANVEWYYNTDNKVKFYVIANGTKAGGVKSFESGKTITSRGINLPSGEVKLRLEVKEDADSSIRLDKVVIKSKYANSTGDDNSDDNSGNDNPGNDSEVVEGDIVLGPNDSMTLQRAIESIQAGNTIYLKPGTYTFSKSLVIQEGNDGRANAMKKVFAYGNQKPVIDFSPMKEDSSNRGVILAGDYWYFKNIIIQKAGDNGMLLAGNNNKLEECVFRYNRDSGLQVSRINSDYDNISQWPSNNLILNCESHDNCDSDHEDADGFAPKLTCGEGNVFRGCVSHHNIDDGWDLYTKSSTGPIGVVRLEDCTAHNNGTLSDGYTSGHGDKNGYKLGDDTAAVAHILINCIAKDNGKHGFTGNGNPAQIIFKNCGGSGNGEKLFTRLDNAKFID